MSQTNKAQVTKHRNINTLNNNHPAPHTATNSNNVNSPKEVKKMGGRGQEQLRGYARERKPPNAHKKGTPANHLLNYSLNIPKPNSYTPVVNYKGGWVQKERYLQANFHFTVKGEALYSDPVTPDYLAKWHYIKDVTLPTLDECQCPICLEPPTAPKITKCGHLFCWPCLLHYFNATFISSDLPAHAKTTRAQNKGNGENNTPTPQGYEKLKRSAELVRTIGDLEVDQMYKKCPFCSELFSLSEIKPVHILQMHRYQEGDELEMTLLKRNKLSTVPIPSALWVPKLDFRFPNSSSSSSLFSRFQVEENESINSAGYTALEMAILQREKDQLTTALLLSSPDDTDHLFLDLALLQIQTIQDRIFSSISSNPPSNEKAEDIEPPSKSPARVMDPHAPPFVPSALNISNDAIKLNVNNNNNMNNKNMNVSKTEEGDYVYFYQEKSGLKFFLHPICSKALIIEYGSQSNFPPHLTAKILQIDEVTVDDYFRKRYKFLSHLPLSTICYFCEVEMKHLVSSKTLKSMGNVFKERKIARKHIQLEKQREAIPSPLFPKTSIDWNDSPALPVYFEAQYHVDQEEEGEEEGEGMKSPQWVPNSSALSLDKLKSSPLRISPSLSYSTRSSQRSVGDGDEEDGDEVPDYSQSFFNSISSLSLPSSSSSSSSSKKKKKQNKVLFFDTSQKRKY